MATASPTPAMPPPPGVTSNFVDPETLTDENNIAMGICIPLITIFFFLRVYVRINIRKSWIFEDWLSLAAWASTMSLAALGASTMAHYGGRHKYDITYEQSVEAAYWFNVTTVNYGIAICITKLSVLWYYRRVFSPSRKRPFDISIVCLIVLLILFYGATTIVKICACIPRARIWDKRIPGSCINTPVLLDTSGMFNILTDVIILLLPVKAVWKLKLTLKQKVLVVGVFTFGLCAPIFSTVGFIVRLQGNGNNDESWIQPKIIMWGLAETTTGMLCVSFPELGPIIRGRKRHMPSENIVNGHYRSDDRPRPRSRSRGVSTVISQGMMKLDNDPYIELDERDVYSVQHAIRQPLPGEITITREIIQETH